MRSVLITNSSFLASTDGWQMRLVFNSSDSWFFQGNCITTVPRNYLPQDRLELTKDRATQVRTPVVSHPPSRKHKRCHPLWDNCDATAAGVGQIFHMGNNQHEIIRGTPTLVEDSVRLDLRKSGAYNKPASYSQPCRILVSESEHTVSVNLLFLGAFSICTISVVSTVGFFHGTAHVRSAFWCHETSPSSWKK